MTAKALESQRQRRAVKLEQACPLTPKMWTLFFAWNLLRVFNKAEIRRKAALRYENKFPGRKAKLERRRYVENPEPAKLRSQLWYSENSEYAKDRMKAWSARPGEAQFLARLSRNLRCRVLDALAGICKSSTTLELIGCSVEKLKNYLEKQFKPGMSWENHGTRGWHIDHIRPCASFDLRDPEQQKLCFHFSNLQPLWAVENQKKADTYVLC